MLSALSEKPSISAELNGQKTQEVIVGGSTRVEKVDGGINTTNVQEIPVEFLVLLCLGWLLPSPQEMVGGLIKLLKGGVDG